MDPGADVVTHSSQVCIVRALDKGISHKFGDQTGSACKRVRRLCHTLRDLNIPTYRVITLFLGVIDERGLDSEKGELQNSERGEG